jgi:hypothetical protein
MGLEEGERRGEIYTLPKAGETRTNPPPPLTGVANATTLY